MPVKAVLLLAFFMITTLNMFAIADDQPQLSYLVSMPAPHSHYFEVETTLLGYQKEFADFKMPVWTPGSYLIREYPKNVEGFEALDGNTGLPVRVEKTSKNCWRVRHQGAGKVIIKYKVYAFDGSIRMSYLDESHAFIMANTLLMYIDDLRWNGVKITLNIPEGWKQVSTALEAVAGESYTYRAANYDELVDSPIEVGNHEVVRFKAAGVDHEIAMYGQTNHDSEQLIRDFSRIIETATSIFGENPNKRYVFIVHNTGKRQGGLEHTSSTVLGLPRSAYDTGEAYLNFLNLVAHEYFHLWMVKRLKPIEFDTIDYDKEVYTDLLWVMEGLTSYYDEKIMLRAGFYDEHRFISNLLHSLAVVNNTPGAAVQSVAESSFDAWIKAYRKDENSENTQISYYTKGLVIGAMLDLAIISNSNGKSSLDDVVRYLYSEFYKKKGIGISAGDFKTAAETIGNFSLDEFYNDYVYGTKPLEIKKYLADAGIFLQQSEGSDSNDFGALLEQKEGNVMIKSIARGGAAYQAGFSAGDELISLHNQRAKFENFRVLFNQFTPGQTVKVVYSRDGLVGERTIVVEKDKRIGYSYSFVTSSSKNQKMVYKKWLE